MHARLPQRPGAGAARRGCQRGGAARARGHPLRAQPRRAAHRCGAVAARPRVVVCLELPRESRRAGPQPGVGVLPHQPPAAAALRAAGGGDAQSAAGAGAEEDNRLLHLCPSGLRQAGHRRTARPAVALGTRPRLVLRRLGRLRLPRGRTALRPGRRRRLSAAAYPGTGQERESGQHERRTHRLRQGNAPSAASGGATASPTRCSSCCCRCIASTRSPRPSFRSTAPTCSPSASPTTARATARRRCPGSAPCWRARASPPMAKCGCRPSRACSAMFSTRSASGTATTAPAISPPCWPRYAIPSASATTTWSPTPTAAPSAPARRSMRARCSMSPPSWPCRATTASASTRGLAIRASWRASTTPMPGRSRCAPPFPAASCRSPRRAWRAPFSATRG